MGRLLFRCALVVAGLVVLLITWVVGARPLTMLLDRLHTVEMDSKAITRLGVADAERGMLQVNQLPMSTATPEYSPYPMEMKVTTAREFVVQIPGHTIVLGRVDELLGVNPPAGDRARLRIERSMLSWPTPLEINFMTGHSPSWKRHIYYRLTWEKPDGARFEMVWRYEQYYYDSWASGFMTRAGTTGLIRMDIRR